MTWVANPDTNPSPEQRSLGCSGEGFVQHSVTHKTAPGQIFWL